MRHRRWLPAVLVAALLLPARDADALWEFIRDLSGPGPWYGGDIRYSIALSTATRPLTRELNNENVDTLKRMGLKTAFMEGTVEEFVGNPEHRQLIEDEFGVSLPRPQECPLMTDAASKDPIRSAARLFLCATQIDSTQPKRLQKLPLPRLPVPKLPLSELPLPDLKARLDAQSPTAVNDVQLAEERRAELERVVLSNKTDELRNLIRHYDTGGLGGIGGMGLFGSFRPVPDLKQRGEDVRINNGWFFSPSVGVAFSLDNKIPYPEGITASKHVLWLSLYLPVEKRFKAFGSSESVNWFTQIGLAGHLFVGDRFKSFTKGSVRGRMGIQLGQGYVAFQLDYFVPGIRNEQFGGIPDPDAEHFAIGFVFGINVN